MTDIAANRSSLTIAHVDEDGVVISHCAGLSFEHEGEIESAGVSFRTAEGAPIVGTYDFVAQALHLQQQCLGELRFDSTQVVVTDMVLTAGAGFVELDNDTPVSLLDDNLTETKMTLGKLLDCATGGATDVKDRRV